MTAVSLTEDADEVGGSGGKVLVSILNGTGPYGWGAVAGSSVKRKEYWSGETIRGIPWRMTSWHVSGSPGMRGGGGL